MDPRQSRFTAPLDAVQVRDSGAASGAWSFTGHAAVFNQRTDLGPFEEQIAPGAFARSLEAQPLEVLAVLNHDPGLILGATMNNTLELREDPVGLHFWSRPPATQLASETRILVEEGYLRQASFKFTIAAETWTVNERDGEPDEVFVTIDEVDTLFDVSLCGLGAYPQTDVSVASRERLTTAISEGRVPGLTLDDARERGIVVEDPERSQPAGEEVVTETGDVALELWLEQARAATEFARATQ